MVNNSNNKSGCCNVFPLFCCLILPILLLFTLPKCHFCAIVFDHNQPSSVPSSSFSSQLSSPLFSSEVRFMQKLFDRFERGDGIGNSAIGYAPTVSVKECSTDGSRNTVLGWGLKFALNKLAPTERYVRAELHLHGRLDPFLDDKKTKLTTPPLHIVQFMCSSDKWTQKIGKNGKDFSKWPKNATGGTIWPSRKISLGLAQTDQMDDKQQKRNYHRHHQIHSPGWSTFDAMTPLLYASMDNAEQQQDELHINFHRYRKPLDERQLNRFIHIHRPFLVVYTEELAPPKIGGAEGKFAGTRAKRDIRATLTDYDNFRHQMDKVRKTAEYFSYGMAKGNANGAANDAQTPTENGGDGNDFDTFRRLNRRRKMKNRKSKSAQKKYPGFDANDPMLGFGTPFSPWQRMSPSVNRRTKMLQSPNAGTSLNDILGLREHGYWFGTEIGNGTNRANAGGETETANDETKLFILDENPQKSERCAWHNMTVDFHQLGWSDRIIAPKRFEAGFCGGHCDYPLENESNPSNHAILQSLIATQQKREGRAAAQPQRRAMASPSAVCCAPAEFDSLTLLYFDERDNVVLKNYPRMVVLSCGCL
ncbi:hypothetical protein niasHT_031666 [Heterodera trifolii]|uniref:TGF-beta family profile domain-containing protein n=1 Tax=Heterodera trifolii TaxID=157864 RepID=A0ABD2IZT3_9BILA